MSNVTEVIKTLSLNLTNIPDNKREEAKRRAGNYLLNEIFRNVGTGASPVEGEGKFKLLDKKYAKKEHGGRRLSILELEGDLLAALKVTDIGGNSLEVGVKGKEAPKADGHNQLSNEAKLWAASKEKPFPKRRFIPASNQKFKASITEGINRILDGFREEEPKDLFREEEELELGTPSSVIEEPERIGLDVEDFFSDEVIESLLLDALKKQGRI